MASLAPISAKYCASWGREAAARHRPMSAQAGGGLGDLMGEILGQLGQAAPSTGQPSGTGIGGLGQVLGQIFGQATSGVREGAGRVQRGDRCQPEDRRHDPPDNRPELARTRCQDQGADRAKPARRPGRGGRARHHPARHQDRPQPCPRRRQARGPRADRRPRLQGLSELHPGPARCQGGRTRSRLPHLPQPDLASRPRRRRRITPFSTSAR